jgi:hypothetical protein
MGEPPKSFKSCHVILEEQMEVKGELEYTLKRKGIGHSLYGITSGLVKTAGRGKHLLHVCSRLVRTADCGGGL